MNRLKQLYRNRNVKWILSAGLSILVMGWLFTKVSPLEIFQVLREARTEWLLIGLGFFGLFQLMRTLRIGLLLLSGYSHLFRLFGIQCTYAFFNNILPAGTGEASYVILLRKIHAVPYVEGVTSLALTRLIDIGVLGIFAIGLVVVSQSDLPNFVLPSALILLGLVLVAGAVLVLLYRFSKREWGWSQHWLVTPMGKIMAGFRHYLEQVHSWRSYGLVVLISFGMWLSMAGMFVANVWALQYHLNLAQIMFIFVLLWPINVLPIKGFANFGSHEGGWIIVLSLLGVPQLEAIRLAIGTHLIALAYVLIIALVGLVVLLVESWRSYLLKNNESKVLKGLP